MIPFRDGTYRWRVYFEGEYRDVFAPNEARAKKVAEYAQRLTNAPKQSRKAQSVVLTGGSDGYIGKPFLIGTPIECLRTEQPSGGDS